MSYFFEKLLKLPVFQGMGKAKKQCPAQKFDQLAKDWWEIKKQYLTNN